MDFYQALANVMSRTPGRSQLIVIGSESAEKLSWFIEQYQLNPDRVVALPEPDPRVSETLPLLAANRRGVIQRIWGR